MGNDTTRRGSWALAVFVVVLATSAVHFFLHFPRLPDTVASHFGAGGRPDGWTSKESFAAWYGITHLVLVVIFLGVPLCIGRLPNSWISLPRKDYWLAPERRERALRMVGDSLRWMGTASLLFVLVTAHLVFEVNLGVRETLGPLFLWALVAFLTFTLIWSVRFVRRFQVTGQNAGEREREPTALVG